MENIIFTGTEIKAPNYYHSMADSAHILIGGTTGSGKSVALNGLICSMLYKNPNELKLILIDPKGVELLDYADLPHTLTHARSIEDIEFAIHWAFEEMERRYNEMIEARQKLTSKGDIYIVIDEYVDLKFGCSKKALNELARISAKGRASKVHIILCTQRPTQQVIDGIIQANFTTVLALRTKNPQESRNLILQSGCEKLPPHGRAYLDMPSLTEPTKVCVPMIEDETIKQIVNYWLAQMGRKLI